MPPTGVAAVKAGGRHLSRMTRQMALRSVNLIEDLMERPPASRLGIVAVDAEGNRRDWHFGELIACSAGLSGAFAARGVGRGDVVMTLVGNRIEWVLTMLACWRMGAVALPCNTMLRPARPRAAGRCRRANALRGRSGSARGPAGGY